MRSNYWILALLISVLGTACEQQKSEPTPPTAEKHAPPAEAAVQPDINTGKALAEQCVECHGLDGGKSKNIAPFIGGQHADYIVTALQAYKNDTRKNDENHAFLKSTSDDDLVHLSAYYASLDTTWLPQKYKSKQKVTGISKNAIAAGKRRSASCVDCHGEEGNSVIAGVPTLAGLQYDYFRAAVNAYFKGKRVETKAIMKNFKHAVNQREINNLAAYYSTRKAKKSDLPTHGNKKKGEKIAATQCAGCHGVDGNSINPTMPSLTGQNQEYLVKAISAYKNGTRKHRMMQDAVKRLSNKDIENLSGYFASQKPQKIVGDDATPGAEFNVVAEGQKIAASCNGCHGEQGNSSIAGTPSLTGLHPDYIALSINAYKDGQRKHETMKSLVASLNETDIEKLAVYYATQEPKPSNIKTKGDAAAGQKLVASCNSCHGAYGNSTKPDTPALAGQNPSYVLTALKDYASGKRINETMQSAAKELNEEQIQNIVAYYAAQKPVKLEGIHIPQGPEILTEKCSRCHGDQGISSDPGVPILAGQIEAYLVKALQDYRSGIREHSTMLAMADVLSLNELKAVAAYYASQSSTKK